MLSCENLNPNLLDGGEKSGSQFSKKIKNLKLASTRIGYVKKVSFI